MAQIRKITNIFLLCIIQFQFLVSGQNNTGETGNKASVVTPKPVPTPAPSRPAPSPAPSKPKKNPPPDNSDNDDKDMSKDDEDGENQICSTSSITLANKTFTYIWKVNSFMPSLSLYEDIKRLLEIQTNEVDFKDDVIKGKWTFKVTNTKVEGLVAVYANYSIGLLGVDEPLQYFKISLKYSSKKYKGASYYESTILEATDQAMNEIINSPMTSTSSSKSDKNRIRDEDDNYSYVEIKYPMDTTAKLRKTNNFIFEFPTFDISSQRERSSKITESQSLKLYFTIQAFYPVMVQEITNSCKGVE